MNGFLLGELISMCGGANPFQSGIRFPILKNDITKMPETDLQFQYLSQLNAYKQVQARVLADPWSALMLQQQENAAQRLIMQQQVNRIGCSITHLYFLENNISNYECFLLTSRFLKITHSSSNKQRPIL